MAIKSYDFDPSAEKNWPLAIFLKRVVKIVSKEKVLPICVTDAHETLFLYQKKHKAGTFWKSDFVFASKVNK